MSISPSAESARESARESDGKFGTQLHAEPAEGTSALAGPSASIPDPAELYYDNGVSVDEEGPFAGWVSVKHFATMHERVEGDGDYVEGPDGLEWQWTPAHWAPKAVRRDGSGEADLVDGVASWTVENCASEAEAHQIWARRDEISEAVRKHVDFPQPAYREVGPGHSVEAFPQNPRLRVEVRDDGSMLVRDYDWGEWSEELPPPGLVTQPGKTDNTAASGRGVDASRPMSDCEWCDGRGTINHLSGGITRTVACPDCDGTGRVVRR